MVDVDALTSRQRSLAFFTLLVALVLEIVDMTIVNTALPAIEKDLGAAAAQSQWVVAGYSLTFAILLILGGRLGDLFGGRIMFLVGVGGFTVASLLCGISQTSHQLIAARIVQGATGAMMAPQVMTMIQLLYSPVERIGRIAWFGVVGGFSAILGPIIGGLLIAGNPFGLSWRSIFLINVPIGICALAAGLMLLPKAARHPERRIDLTGTLLFGAALFAFLFPLIREDRQNWGIDQTLWIMAGIGLAIAGWAGLMSRRNAGRPTIIEPDIFEHGTFNSSVAISLAFSAANTGFLFVFAYALQREMGYSALETGMLHIPFSVGVMFGIAFLGRRYLAEYGRLVLMVGATAMAIGCAGTLIWMASATNANVIPVLPLLVIAGIGMGLVSGPIGSVAVARVERHQAGSASGILKTFQQMGSALGVAIGGTSYFLYAPTGQGEIAALVIVVLLLLGCVVLAAGLPSEIFLREKAAQ